MIEPRRCRRRREPVLAAVARTFRTGTCHRAGYPDAWSDSENVLLAIARARPRPLIADRLG